MQGNTECHVGACARTICCKMGSFENPDLGWVWAAVDDLRRGWWSIEYMTDVGPVCVLTVQVALMSEVARARAVVDGHAGVAGVVEAWLGFLTTLAYEEANKVRC